MRDRPIILAGLAVFLAVATLPFWLWGRLQPAEAFRPTGCILPSAYMSANHMRLLSEWRDLVVRSGQHEYRDSHGAKHAMSLTRTCMTECHHDRAKFCDRCHMSLGVGTLACWSCHDGGAR